MAVEDLFGRRLSRRTALKLGVAGAVASELALLEQLAWVPLRAQAAGGTLPDIQFDIGNFIAPPVVLNDGAGSVKAGFGPVFSTFTPARLTRTPRQVDQRILASALNTIEQVYPFSPAGVIMHISYGIPYFNRLPGGFDGPLVSFFMPSHVNDESRPVLEEAVPSPTDVVGGVVGGPNATFPGRKKDRFNVNVSIEANDLLFHLRSDRLSNLTDVLAWLKGSNSLRGQSIQSPRFFGLYDFQQTRVQFTQRGLPRKVANAAGFEFAQRINPDSPMFMGFLDQQVDSSATPEQMTFAGSLNLTDSQGGDYFDNGSIVHLSHDIEDLYQFYSLPFQDPRHPDGETFMERAMYMFRANQIGTINGLPAQPFDINGDTFTNGGGPAFVPNHFQGNGDAFLDAQDADGLFDDSNATPDKQQRCTFTGKPRIGHEQALHRFGRLADGTPLHMRVDGPGFDGLDVPAFEEFPGGGRIAAGTAQPKLQFAAFVPTAEIFRKMREGFAAQDLEKQFNVDKDDNGLDRFITATRRQNYLTPPRRHRALPLLEFVSNSSGAVTLPSKKKG